MFRSISKIFIIVLLLVLIFTSVVFAQSPDKKTEDKIFKARVLEVLEQRENTLPDGVVALQQRLRLVGLEGEFSGQEFVFDGIGNFDVVKKHLYNLGDRVLVLASTDFEGNINYYILDHVRTNAILLLAGIFVLTIIIVGRFKGVRSIIALVITFLIIIKYIVPQILSGANPLFVTLIGSLAILLIIIYLTEGINTRSHITVVSIFISLILTIIISKIFVGLVKLSGLGGEEVSFLINLGSKEINFEGLLLAGIIIGALGVLDDVVISQVASTEEILKADPYQTRKELFKKVYRVGVSHISSMTNTLFLAYAGVSLPLLVLFVSGESAFSGFSQIINNEIIATEIVRTLAGSIGLILAVPIATFVAVWWFKIKKRKL